MEICENLSEEDRLLAQIYILALTDRSKYHESSEKIKLKVFIEAVPKFGTKVSMKEEK